MATSGVSNLFSVYAQSYLNQTNARVQKTLEQLSSGSRINSAADDPAGISMVDEMQAQDSYLSQLQTNNAITEGSLNVASGALSQVNSLLDQQVTLSTAAANGTLTPAQENANNLEYQSNQALISQIESNTSYNGSSVFANNPAASSLPGIQQSLNSEDLSSSSDAQSALSAVNSAVSGVSAAEGGYGTQINALDASSAVDNTEETNTQAALNAIQATDYAKASSELEQGKLLMQAGLSVMA
jgi:flagellin